VTAADSDERRFVLYAGHIVWARDLRRLRAAAERRRLAFEHRKHLRMLCVKLAVTVRGEQEALAEYAAFVDHWYGGQTPDAALGQRPEAY